MCLPPWSLPTRYRRWTYGLGLAGMMSACVGHPSPSLQTRPVSLQQGLAELNRELLRNPNAPEPYCGLAQAYLALGHLEHALEAARTAASLSPPLAQAYVLIAEALLRLHVESAPLSEAELEEAHRAMARAVELAPSEPHALEVAFELALLRFDVKAAEDFLNRRAHFERDPLNLSSMRGRLLLYRHEFEEARRYFRLAYQRQPDHRWAAFEAEATFLMGEDSEALALYESVPDIALQQDDRLVLSILALRRNELDEALVQLRARAIPAGREPAAQTDLVLVEEVRAGQLKPNAVAHLFESRLAMRLNDLDRVEQNLRRALDIDRRLPHAPEALATLLLNDRKDPRQAIKALADAPSNTATYERYYVAVEAFKQLQDAIGAQEVLREFVELVALDVEADRRAQAEEALETMVLSLPVPSLWRFLLDLYQEDYNSNAVLESWERLRGEHPKLDIAFLTATGEALLHLNRLDAAERLLRTALQREPTHAQLLLLLAKLAETQADLELAEEVYRRVTVIHPSEPTSWLSLGAFYLGQKSWTEALSAFEEVLRRETDHAEGLAGAARALMGMKRRDEALALARRLTNLAPGSLNNWLLLAEVAADARRYDEQEQALRRAVHRHAQLAEAWHALARFLLSAPDPRFRKPEEALSISRTAVELSKNRDPLQLSTLADAYLELGRPQDALPVIEQALARRPESDALHRQRRRARNALESATSSTGNLP
ncbi:MAG: tetratricopeptide repeat protein [Myxococcota bacterium]